MLTSRKIDDLAFPAKVRALKFIGETKADGIDLLVTCTLRDAEAQRALYAQGRSAPGAIVTWADAGDSYHQYGVALDVVPLLNGKPVWGTVAPADLALWQRVGAIGERCGLEWAGRWSKRKREYPHFQFTGGLAVARFKAGDRISKALWMPPKGDAA